MELETTNAGLEEQVDHMEASLDAGWQVPGTSRVLVDRTRMLDLIDQIRVAIPEQVQAARQVLAHGDQVLAAARAEADAVLAEAHRQAHRRLADKAFDRAAAIRAAEIEDQAWRTAEAIKRQADQQAAEWLRSLRARLDQVDQTLSQRLPFPERVHEPQQHLEADVRVGRSASRPRRKRAA
jgi:hypothetical protein